MEQEEDRTKTLRSDRQTKGMRSMRINSARIAVFVIALSTFCVHAEILQYSIDVDNGGSNYSAGSSGTFELTQFNPSQGTLESVLVEITGNSFGGYNKIDNEKDVDTGNATVTIGSNVTVTGPGTLVVLTQPQQSESGFVDVDSDDAADFVGTDALGVTGTSSTDTQSDSPSDFSSYIGSGTIEFGFSSFGNQSAFLTSPLSFDDLAFDGADPTFNFSAVITYTYTVIPEPATGLILVAGGGILMIRRRFSLC